MQITSVLSFGKTELFRVLKSYIHDNQLIVTNPARQQLVPVWRPADVSLRQRFFKLVCSFRFFLPVNDFRWLFTV